MMGDALEDSDCPIEEEVIKRMREGLYGHVVVGMNHVSVTVERGRWDTSDNLKESAAILLKLSEAKS